MKSVVPWKFGDYNHTHNILQKWLAPTIVLNVSLQKQHFPRALFQIWYLFYIYIYIWFFWNIYVFWEKKKKIQTNRKGQMVIIVHFVYRNPVWVSRFHTKKAPELTTLQRHQVRSFREPFFGGEVVVILPGLSPQRRSTTDKIPPQ